VPGVVAGTGNECQRISASLWRGVAEACGAEKFFGDREIEVVVASLGMGNSGSELALSLREVPVNVQRKGEREIPEADEAEDRHAKCRYAGEASVLENPRGGWKTRSRSG